MVKPIVFARMDQDLVDLIKKICRLRGEDLSDFVRRAVKLELARLSYLSEDEKKALGFSSVSYENTRSRSSWWENERS
jgi:hypothetical protein